MEVANDMDFEEEVVAYLQEHTYARKEELIDILIRKHTKPTEAGNVSVELGYSKPTINRHLKSMVEAKLIVTLKGDDISKYGFPDVDGRAAYLVLPETLKYKLHFDEVLNFLESGDAEDVKVALKEMELYEQEYTFDSKQLDSLVRKLASSDIGLVNTLYELSMYMLLKRG